MRDPESSSMDSEVAVSAENATSGAPGPGPSGPYLERSAAILTAYGLQSVVDLAKRKADPQRQTRAVVVVGEVKRGKSSLVNALVGRRDLCPVGVDVTSSVSVTVEPAQPTDPENTAVLRFPDREESVPLTDLVDWVTVDGRRVTDPRTESLPLGAVIPIADSALTDTVLVDTPGVGGLDTSAGALATQSAEQARVLLLVCDAGSPLTAPEMEFARNAGASVDSLIVVVTKTDKNLRRWQAIVEDNRRLLKHHLNRDVSVIGVSSLRAVIAAELPGDQRVHLEELCGIAALRREIRERLDRSALLPDRDAIRTTLEGLRQVATKVDGELAAVEAGAERIPDLSAELERLTELKDTARQWEQYLARDITLIRQTAIDDVEHRLDEIRDKWTHYINTHGMAVLRHRSQKFTADMQADLQMAMAETLAAFLRKLHDDVVVPRFGDDELVWEQLCTQIVASMQDKRIETHQVASKRHGLLDPTVLSMGVMGSSMIGGLIGLTAVAGVGIVAGGVWIGLNLGFRAMRSGKTNLLAWLRETVSATKQATNRLVESAVAQSRPEIVIQYREYLRINIETLQREIDAAQKSANADEATRKKSIERLTNNKTIVAKRIAEGEALLRTDHQAPEAITA